MPYVKPTVHLSRIAGTALKSFTHGYAQTVVAASQSSYAAQNTPAGPLADTLIGRFRKSERSRLQSVLQNADGSRQASSSNAPSANRPETSHQDAGLDKYFDAWQKHQHHGTKEWQQFQFAKRIEWQPPTTVPAHVQESAAAEENREQEEDEQFAAPSLKRSYTTSALDNFGKAFINDEAAEAVALEQVNISIAEEIQRSKDDAEDLITLKASSTSAASQEASSAEERSISSPATVFTPTSNPSSTPEGEFYFQELLRLAEIKQHERVPAAFQAMLLSLIHI